MKIVLFSDGLNTKSLFDIWKSTLKKISMNDISLFPGIISGERVWNVIINKTTQGREIVRFDENHRVLIFLHSGDSDITESNSFLREIITKFSLLDGKIWLHGSAFTVGKKGILVIGPKGSGKTTWLLLSYFKMDSRLIVNDQVPVNWEEGKLITNRWRPDIKISSNSLSFLKLSDEKNISKTEDDERKYIWLPDNQSMRLFDFHGICQRRRENISPFPIDKKPIFIDSFKAEINVVVILTESGPKVPQSCSPGEVESLFNTLLSDKENILPEYLKDWKNKVPFWDDKITECNITENMLQSQWRIMDFIINHIAVFHANRRMEQSEILSFLKKIKDYA